MRTWHWYSKVLFALAILAFAYFVWPTPWHYHTVGRTIIRVNRLTGEVEQPEQDPAPGTAGELIRSRRSRFR